MERLDAPSTTSGPRRGRPPNDENRRAILEATRQELAEVGFGHMTFEAVAARAGLYRRYISRTWASKAELIIDALFDDAARFTAPDTGDLESDLRVLLARHVDLTLRPDFLRGLPGVQDELRSNPELWVGKLDRYIEPAMTSMDTVLARAVDRGEITGYRPAVVVVNTVSGALQQLAALGLLDREELIEHVVGIVVDALVDRT